MPLVILLVVVVLAYAVFGSGGSQREAAVTAAIGSDDDRWAGCARPQFWHPDYEEAARDCAADRAERAR